MVFYISGIVLLVMASILLGYGLLLVINWINLLSKFIMLIYKDEVARIAPRTGIMPPVVLGFAFFVWRIAEFLLTRA